jgi:hypothetical protein
MGEVAAMSTGQRADDDDVVPGVAGSGFDAVLASSIPHSARIPAKTAARVVGAILRTPRPAARRLGRDKDDLPKLAKLDRRFADPAWHGNPVLRRLAMSYLAWADAVNDVLTAPRWTGRPGSGPRYCSTTWSPPPRRPTYRS